MPVLSSNHQQRRPARRRAFAGLVGRESTEDFPAPAGITDAPLPKFDIEKDYAAAVVRFQRYAFDPSLRGVNPKSAYEKEFGASSSKPTGPTSRTGDPDGRGINPISEMKSSPGLGMSVIELHPEKPRHRMPWWIASERVFDEFLLRLVNAGADEEDYRVLKGRELRKAVGLDFLILYEFYFAGREDDEIFEQHRDEFRKEISRQRTTSSASAVKKRRQRLVEAGNAIFGRDSRPVEGPEHREHRALWSEIRLGPALKSRKNGTS